MNPSHLANLLVCLPIGSSTFLKLVQLRKFQWVTLAVRLSS